jgi:hypothetical protein
MKLLKIFLGLLLFSTIPITIFAEGEPCPAYREDCIIEQQGSKIDQVMYEFSKATSDALFFGENSILRTPVFQNNTVASYLNILVIKILAVFFQIWYLWVVFQFYSTKGDLEREEQARDSLKRFLFALGAIAVSSILYLVFSSFMSSLNASIADTGGIDEIFAPNPIYYASGDAGIISSMLRIILIILMMILAIPLMLFKMAESLLLPLFTLFLFLHFANKKVASKFILDLLIYAMLLPSIFFLTIMIFNSLFSVMTGGLKTAIVFGILAVGVSGFVFVFMILKLSFGAVVRSLITHVSGSVFQGISKGLRKAYKK